MTPDPAALAACPFCGGPPVASEMRCDDDGYCAIECTGPDGHFCGVHTEDWESAVRFWNARAPAEASDQETADLFGSVLERSEFANAGRLELLDLMPLVRAILTRLGLAIVRAGAR